MSTKISGSSFKELTVDNLILTNPLPEQYGGSGSTGVYKMGYATAKTATGTFVDFTGIPSWAKRVTVMFNGVSTNGTSAILIQLGSGSITTSGYNSVGSAHIQGTAPSLVASSAGFAIFNDNATDARQGVVTINAFGFNMYNSMHIVSGTTGRNIQYWGSGNVNPLSGAMDRIRITTVNGTDLFDAGTINVMWEGFV